MASFAPGEPATNYHECVMTNQPECMHHLHQRWVRPCFSANNLHPPSPTWASSGSRDLHIVTSSPKLKQHCESALPHKEQLTTRVEYVEQAAEAEQHPGRIRHNHRIPGYHTRSTKLWQPHHHPQCLHVFHHSIIL